MTSELKIIDDLENFRKEDSWRVVQRINKLFFEDGKTELTLKEYIDIVSMS